MRHITKLKWAVGLALVLAAWLVWPSQEIPTLEAGQTMPEFTTSNPNLWLNSKPLKKADLAGKVILIEVWTSV